ncbi:hypothetical protein [Streptococcus parasanguinis]|uniref:hypothetical protein n=1 Tax=Streptococcus parasanguinis TaxID=1318 RepID=UPI0004E0C28C|nr:hypothetical protein [Streptococcus parasanguinis]
MNLYELYKEYDDLIKRYNEYVVYSKPLVEIDQVKIVSGSKYIVVAPADVLDRLENEVATLEKAANEECSSNVITIGRNRLRSASSLSLSIKNAKHTSTTSVENCLDMLYRFYHKSTEREMSNHRVALQELHLAKNKTTDAEELKKLSLSQNLEVERHESTLKELSDKYDSAIELLSKYDKNRAVRVSSRTGSSYRLNYYDHENDKRSHVSLNNLVMIDNDASNMPLEHTAKRKQRNDTKKPLVKLNTLSIYEPLEILYDEYISNRKC